MWIKKICLYSHHVLTEMAGFKCAPEILAVVQIAIVTAMIQTEAIWNKPTSESVNMELITEPVPICTIKKVPRASANSSRSNALFHNRADCFEGTTSSAVLAAPPRRLHRTALSHTPAFVALFICTSWRCRRLSKSWSCRLDENKWPRLEQGLIIATERAAHCWIRTAMVQPTRQDE